MNFFEYQQQARRRSSLLIALFAAAILGLIAITTLFAIAVVAISRGEGFSLANFPQPLGWENIAGIAAFIGAVILLASLYKLKQLAAGGRAVAESLGGRKINVAPHDAAEQRALNVVEEMAIASGTPVPEVYIIEDPAINAFAAGYKPSDAVVGLTRGCIEQLNREELQGVVAHEFSHIFNGDMRLNLRIVGLLHGILVIGMAGYWLLRGSSWSSSRRNRGRGAQIGVALGLIAIGYTGTFFGNLIKAAVSRQREYLADASAVQFTRSSRGIGGALKKIAGYSAGSRISSANAAQFSHMYFASAVKSSFSALLATHPPLPQRIQRIDPSWKYESAGQTSDAAAEGLHTDTAQHEQISAMAGQAPQAPVATTAGPATRAPAPPPAAVTDCSSAALNAAIDNSIANPSGHQFGYGQTLLRQAPEDLKRAARDPFAARALVYALLMHPEHRAAQLTLLEKVAHPAVMRTLQQLLPTTEALDMVYRLPLLDLCVPSLKDLAPQQYQVFKRNLIKLLRSDGRVDIWEWALYRVLMHALEERPDRQRLSTHKRATQDASRYLLAAVAHCAEGDYLPAKRAYDAGLQQLRLPVTPLPTQSDMQLQRLDKALAIAATLPPLQKPLLLKAMATTLAHDGHAAAQQVELLRAVADCLDCPLPPLLPPSATAHMGAQSGRRARKPAAGSQVPG